MKTYARIESGFVAELLSTRGDILSMFHRGLTWVDATHTPGVRPGWLYDGSNFSPYPAQSSRFE